MNALLPVSVDQAITPDKKPLHQQKQVQGGDALHINFNSSAKVYVNTRTGDLVIKTDRVISIPKIGELPEYKRVGQYNWYPDNEQEKRLIGLQKGASLNVWDKPLMVNGDEGSKIVVSATLQVITLSGEDMFYDVHLNKNGEWIIEKKGLILGDVVRRESMLALIGEEGVNAIEAAKGSHDTQAPTNVPQKVMNAQQAVMTIAEIAQKLLEWKQQNKVIADELNNIGMSVSLDGMGEDNLLIIKIPAKDGEGWVVLSRAGLLHSEIGLAAGDKLYANEEEAKTAIEEYSNKNSQASPAKDMKEASSSVEITRRGFLKMLGITAATVAAGYPILKNYELSGLLFDSDFSDERVIGFMQKHPELYGYIRDINQAFFSRETIAFEDIVAQVRQNKINRDAQAVIGQGNKLMKGIGRVIKNKEAFEKSAKAITLSHRLWRR